MSGGAGEESGLTVGEVAEDERVGLHAAAREVEAADVALRKSLEQQGVGTEQNRTVTRDQSNFRR